MYNSQTLPQATDRSTFAEMRHGYARRKNKQWRLRHSAESAATSDMSDGLEIS